MNGEDRKKITAHIRIGLLDVACLLLVVLSVLGLWQRNNLKNLFETDTTKADFTVSFMMEDVPLESAEALTGGTVLYLSDGTTLGSLSGEPWLSGGVTYDHPNAEGVPVILPPDVRQSVTVHATLLCTGYLRDGALVTEGEALTAGKALTVFSNEGIFLLRVVSITKIQ